jgi:ELWxxDGT repeat protein
MYHTLPTLITRQRLIRSFHLLITMLIGLMFVLPAQADGPAFLVKDINTIPGLASTPTEFVDVNGTLFFIADDGVHGRELWKSNGTSASTIMLKDINPGNVSTFVTNQTNVNGTLFFVAETSAGAALWKSDGTSDGTLMVKAITATQLTNVNGILFFMGSSTPGSRELWKSDGTAAGTIQLKQFGYFPGWFRSLNGKLIFSTDRGPTGPSSMAGNCCSPSIDDTSPGLWQSDGTVAGTVLIKPDVIVENMTQGDDLIFFTTTNTSNGTDLWKSDGTTAGTIAIKKLIPAPGNFSTNFLASSQGNLFFTFYDNSVPRNSGFWKSDGTSAGTSLVKALNVEQDISYAADVNGTLYFAIEGGGFSELWKTNGVAAGTALVKRFAQTNLTTLLNANGTLMFHSSNPTSGETLWKSDGTAAGTTLVQRFHFVSEFSWPRPIVAGPNVWFSHDDQSGIGIELWAIRVAVDTFAQSPLLVGAPPSGMASVPIQYGNNGIASALTLAATLDPGLTYVSDTSGIVPTISGQTLTWHITNASTPSAHNFVLSVRAPNAAYGTRYPITLTVAGASPDSYPIDNTATVQVMIARQVYLPFARRYSEEQKR